MPIKDPLHPGEHVLHDCLEPLGLSVTEAAKVLGVARPTLSRLINGKGSVSLEMAIRLSKAFGGSPRLWLKLQLTYDLAQAQEKADTLDIAPYQPSGTGNGSQFPIGV